MGSATQTAVVSTEKAKALSRVTKKKDVWEGGSLYVGLCCSDIRNYLNFKGLRQLMALLKMTGSDSLPGTAPAMAGLEGQHGQGGTEESSKAVHRAQVAHMGVIQTKPEPGKAQKSFCAEQLSDARY